jgi:glyoxylase-like metal-dependent hydrolase (beta-lactamase superfamily II)
MDIVMPGLYASAPEPLPFAPSLGIRAFLLRRGQGNLLVYSAGALTADTQAVEHLGGISRHYLNHRHEAGFGCDRIAGAFGAPLHCHDDERESVSAKCRVDGTFSERHTLDADFEVIPTPGHTSGATAFLWDNGRHRCLFTGDTIYLAEDGWVAALLAGTSDREAYLTSLELVRELDFDVLVPWAAPAGRPFHALTDKRGAQRRIDAILARLRSGGDR